MPALMNSHVPTTSMPVSHGPGAKFLSRAQMNLHLVQCHLDHQGASKLIVDLVIKSSNNTKIFAEVVELGIALLEGGNQDIQKTVFSQLHSGETGQSFFKVFHDKISEAQLEIKATVSVNTSDIANKANEDKGDFLGKDMNLNFPPKLFVKYICFENYPPKLREV